MEMRIGGNGMCKKCGEHILSGTVHKCEPKEVSVREMINLLLDEDMDSLVIIKKNGKRIFDAEICTREKTEPKN